jgi:type IV secretion/conjugal transfer VirB4 family ATPase
MLNLAEKSRQYEGVAHPYSDHLPWMEMLREDMVLNKDGSLLVCYTFEGVDVESLQIIDQDRYAMLIEHAMRVFNERITVWWTVDRRKTTDFAQGTFESEIATMIDSEWQQTLSRSKQYKNKHYLSILYSPENGASGFMDRMAYFSTEKNQGMIKAALSAAVASLSKRQAFMFDAEKLTVDMMRFDEMIAAFDETIRDANLRRMKGAQLLGYLHDRASPASNGQPVNQPRHQGYLDTYLPDNTLYVGHDVMLFEGNENVYAAAASVKDWPNITNPGLLDMLLGVPGEITISQCFRYIDQNDARNYIDGIRKHNLNSAKGMLTYLKEAVTNTDSDKVDEGKLMMAQDASEALASMKIENRIFGYYNLSIIAYGDTRKSCEETMKNVTQELRQAGFLVVREKLHMLSAWAGTLPGQWGELVRWFFLHTGNMADLSPLWTRGTGRVDNPYLKEQTGRESPSLATLMTEHSTPFHFNFHQGDLAHTMVVGPSRTGKSVFMNFLTSMFGKYAPCRRFIFDKDYSCKIPTLLQGGSHVDMSGEGVAKLNPMMLVADPERHPWLLTFVEGLITSRGYKLTVEDEQMIFAGLKKVAQLPPHMHVLRSLAGVIGPKLTEQLSPWISGGPLAKYFDNEEDELTVGDFTCVEMNGLFFDQRLASAFLEYAFYRISMSLDGRPTMIYLEEAWFMLSDPQFTKRINDWLKTLAKRNAFICMATQSLDELAKSDIFASIIDNIPNKIFLPNSDALAHEDLYVRKFSLNMEQVHRIRNAIPKLNYYMVTRDYTRMVQVRFPPKVLACLRSDAKAQKVFRKHYEERDLNPNWKFNYIEEMCNEK